VDEGASKPGWLEAGRLRVGDRLREADGTEAVVAGLRRNVGRAVVYTLTVARDHTFFVGAAQVLVHNANCVGSLFAKRGIKLDPHALDRLAQRTASGRLTEQDALRAYDRGRLFYNPDGDVKWIRWDPQTGATVAVSAPRGGYVKTIYEQARPSSNWVPQPFRSGS